MAKKKKPTLKSKNVQIMKRCDTSKPSKKTPPKVRNHKTHWNYQVEADICQNCGDLGHRQEKCKKKK